MSALIFSGIQLTMAFRTEISFPVVFHINGVFEFHQIIDGGILNIPCRSLGNDAMAHIAIFGNDLSFFAFMPVGMTAEATV